MGREYNSCGKGEGRRLAQDLGPALREVAAARQWAVGHGLLLAREMQAPEKRRGTGEPGCLPLTPSVTSQDRWEAGTGT